MTHSHTTSLLIELLVEELPPKALRKLDTAFAQGIWNALQAIGLLDGEASQLTHYASPRRLAVHISKVSAQAPDRTQATKLMPVSVAFSADGQPTPALLKKLAPLGGSELLPLLRREPDGKAESVFIDITTPGLSIEKAVQQALDQTLAQLPIPKVMTYQLEQGDNVIPGWTNTHFVRPAHSLVALHGEQVLRVQALGLQAGRRTHGHRFETKLDAIDLHHADDYAQRLFHDGAVIASREERRLEIERQLAAKAAALGLSIEHDDALLDEVTALVERPHVLACQFESDFLQVPPECLILTMKANQKYFPLHDAQGKLTHHFLVVSNVAPEDTRAIVQGNERVIRPRLADAKFFFDQDRKRTLESRVPELDKVVYHGKLGSQRQRSERVARIAQAVVHQLSLATLPFTAEARDEFEVLNSKAQQAAYLAKADLLSEMVGEFPELQGIMGGYYARHEGLRDGVAIAIEDHYKPRFAGDALPRNHTGTVLALADKLETLIGLFGIGQLPTGDKDPYALRRHALGVIRILLEKNLPLALPELIAQSIPVFGDLINNPTQALLAFMQDRLAVLLREQCYTALEVDAILSLEPPRLGDIPARLAAVRAFTQLPESPSLAAANKRVCNILKKASDFSEVLSVNVDKLLEPAEKALYACIESVAADAQRKFAQHEYIASLQVLAALKLPVDQFFEEVMVNAEDAELRHNRLALLARLRQAMNQVADLSRLVA